MKPANPHGQPTCVNERTIRRDAVRLEIAWAGGLFEGEGSVYLDRSRSSRGGKLRIRAGLSTTDLDVIRRFGHAVVFGNVMGPYVSAKSTKPYWTWTTRSTEEVAELARLLWPYLGERRRGMFDQALAAKTEADAEYVPQPKGRRRWFRTRPVPPEQMRLT